MPVPRLCRSPLSRKTLLPPLTRLFPEGGYQAPCSCVGMHTLRVLHALHLPLSVNQTVSGPSWSCYSYKENRDQHLCRGTLSPSPCTASGEEAECGNSQGHCQAWLSHPCRAAWPQLNSALFFHTVSLSEDKEHPFGKFPEREDFSTHGPITTTVPARTQLVHTEKMPKVGEGVHFSTPNLTITPASSDRVIQSPDQLTQKKATFIFVELTQNTGSQAGSAATARSTVERGASPGTSSGESGGWGEQHCPFQIKS